WAFFWLVFPITGFFMKILTTILICSAGCLALANMQSAAAEAGSNAALAVEQVVAEVIANNPSLKAKRANWEAMKERVPQARAWEDLKGEFNSVAGRFVSISPNSFTDQRLVLEQAVPVSGKNRLRGQAAEAE